MFKPLNFILIVFQFFTIHCFAQQWQIQPVALKTRWAKDVSPSNALKEYPRPQMVRGNWQNLNGLWNYAITPKEGDLPKKFEGQILVPFPVESALSGVKKMVQPDQVLWYQRSFTSPERKPGEHVLLHFGAVDWQATVFVNGKEIGIHTGGYDNFSFDATSALKDGANEIAVKVYDPTDQGPNPHGKQVLSPKDIWYTPSTGIWQTVWIEKVPENYISSLIITPNVDGGFINVSVHSNANEPVELVAGKNKATGETNKDIQLRIPNAKLWSPDAPYLYDLVVKTKSDVVKSYFGMRKVEIKKDEKGFDRIFLNNKYIFNLGVLDQGFWPDGIYTAPTDEALAFDIKAIKAMGFNTIRKHIKREPDRWYYWCDKMGMMVWQDMINPAFDLTDEAKKEFETECKENITELYNHPSITTYTLFNEKWGQYDQERLTKWIKQLDPTRLVNGHSGEYLYVNEKLRSPSPNAYIKSDLTDVHAYPNPMNSVQMNGKARVLGEYGGIGVFIPDHQWITGSAWGYINSTPAQLKGKYFIMNEHLELLQREGLCASIYTQPFDVEGEQNGLMTYDREVIKIPFDQLQKIHSQLVPISKGIPMVKAQNADLTDPAIRYGNLLQQYIDGKRDLLFLRSLATAASQVGDKEGMNRANTAYFAQLHKPYTAEDIDFILRVTSKTTDTGFTILMENAPEIDQVTGGRKAEAKLMNIIFSDIISPLQPDWDKISERIKPYGSPGKEILLRAQTVYYGNQKDWNQFATSAGRYIDAYGKHIKAEELDKYARTVFEKIDDKELLLKSAQWSQLAIGKKQSAAFVDTYASLLYKAGKSEEAISQEEKALNLSNGKAELKQKLEKMRRGEVLSIIN